MIRDRLEELKSASSIKPGKEDSVILTLNTATYEESISPTLEKYEEIRKLLDVVKANTDEMRRITSEMTKTFYNPKSFSENMTTKREQNAAYYQKIIGFLKELERDLPEDDDYTTISRMKLGLYHGHKEEIFSVWKDYSQFLLMYEDKIKKIMLRQAEIANHTLTEEESESLLDHNSSIFTGNILQETQKARDNLKELVERYNELTKIEQSLREVKDMFNYMAMLVMQQGEVIQSIEFHAQRAVDNVDKGTTDLDKARESKIKALKKKTCILFWVTAILILLIIILIFT